MAQHLTKCFVDLRGFCFTSQALANLRFDHAESGFHVAALVIVNKKFFTLETVVMKKFLPKLRAAFACRVRLEWNVRCSTVVYYGLEILAANVTLVGAHFFHLESGLCGLLNQCLEVRAIVRLCAAEFDARYNVRSRSASKV